MASTLDRPGEDRGYRFADDHVDSFAAWDLLVFMHHRPETIEDASGYAMLLGRSEEELTRSLDHLCATGAVECVENGNGQRFSLSSDPEVRDSLGAFVDLCTVKECRLEIVRRVLAGYPRE